MASLAPNASYINLSPNYDLITILIAQINEPLDYGTYSFSLTVKSLNFAAYVAQKVFTFSVTIQCTITDLQVIDPIQAQTYVLN